MGKEKCKKIKLALILTLLQTLTLNPQSTKLQSERKGSEWCQDTSDPGHFRPKTFWHHEIGAKVSGQIGTSAELSRGHFSTSDELSRPPANIFASVGRTEERFNITRYYY